MKAMLVAGLLDEVAGLRARGFKDWAPLSSVGYREAGVYLDGGMQEPGELENAILTSTMQLAKRQMTWFKRDPEIQWFDAVREPDRARDAILEIFRSWKS
jgi:tRNA dimethylallyltransferase